MRRVTFLVAESGNIDFDGPVELAEKELERFLVLLRRLFDPRIVEVEDVDELRSERIGDRTFQRPWSIPELSILLEPIGTEGMSRRLGRTWMSVVMKRGEFYGPFLDWVHSKGRSVLSGNMKELIAEYLAEKKLLATQAAKERRSTRSRISQLEEEQERLREEKSKFSVYPRNTEKYAARRKWVLERIKTIPEEIARLGHLLDED